MKDKEGQKYTNMNKQYIFRLQPIVQKMAKVMTCTVLNRALAHFEQYSLVPSAFTL